ncbi:hypothetical protein [Alienimonas chondri]|uniref:Uncharacterized protein n=1 Tax=Alienimonas chondri TaxID=2681879 RepID=A0ABX1VFC3_9PLAN|nr:hypothetical protein [Alienimonas chondri]NNJ26785.1 hypothetical protein [Alienimonas chondri]
MRDTRPDRIKEAIRLAVEEYDRRMRLREKRREALRKQELRKERNQWLGSLALVALLSFGGGRWSVPAGGSGDGYRVIQINSAQERASRAAYVTRQLREGKIP